MLKDQIKNNKKQKILAYFCENCCIRGHHILNCLKTHFIPNEDFLIRRLNFSEPHFDRSFSRRAGKRRENAKVLKKSLDLLSKQLEFQEMISFSHQYPSHEAEDDSEIGKTSETLKNLKREISDSLQSEENVFSPDCAVCSNRNSKFNALEAIKPPDFFMMDFEKACNYESYFPEKNLEHVLIKLENIRKRFPVKGRFKKKMMI